MMRFLDTSARFATIPFRAALLAVVLQTIGAAAAQAVGLVYVDADDGFLTAAPNLSPLSAIDSENLVVTEIDNLWGWRGFGSDGSIFESSNTGNPGAEDSPQLTLTIDTNDGLSSGSNYDVYVAYWSATGQDWTIQAGLTPGVMTPFNRTGPLTFLPGAVAGTSAASALWTTPPLVTVEADRVMLLGKVGTATATGGQINVLVDDLPTTAFPTDIPPANAFNFRSWLDGVAFVEAGTPLTLQVTVNRNNGNLSIANDTGVAVSFTSLSITSASQALNAVNWLSITNNYDQGGSLDTDAWEITAPTAVPLPAFTGALTEIESAGGFGGATLGSGSSVNLGNVWNDSRFQDIQIQMVLASGATVSLTPTYTGAAHILGDLDNSGTLDINDYKKFSLNLHTNVSALGPAEAYLRGDMNGDLLINYADFVALRNVFLGPGGGSLDAFFAEVPEPSSALLSVMGVLLVSTLRRVRRRLSLAAPRLCPAVSPCHSISSAIERTSLRTSSMIRTRLLHVLAALAALAMLPAIQAHAIDVTLNASDVLGTTSFNAAGNWSNAAAPSAGNNYFTGNFALRTPPDGNSYTFAGNSLTVNNTNFDPNVPTVPNGGLWYKGTGNTGTITVNNLILSGGLIVALNGLGDVFNLAGSINVTANSYMHARQGPMNVSAVISGSGTITNPSSDGVGRILRFMSPSNTFTGSIVSNGRFELPDDGRLNFVIGASGVNNSVSGTGAETIFNGDFNLDLSGASTNLGDSWTIVSSTNRTFGPTFNVPGFFEYATGSWVNGIYDFNEATGILSVAPAPDLLTLRVNTASGQASIVNTQPSASFDMNYYEVRSPSGSLDVGGWTSIDGNIPTTTTTWEKAGGSSASLISETNLLGMQLLNPTQSVSLGSAYGGTLPEHQDLEFYYGTASATGTLFRGFVEYVSGGLVGDYNQNGVVDAADYTAWRDTLGQNVAMGTGADGNNNGTIDQGDYTVWKGNFGMAGGSGAAAGITSAVPEPSTILFAWLAACCGPLVRRPRG